MKKNYLLSLVAVAFMVISAACSGSKNRTNSTSFYMDVPAQSWYEALPLGNGRIGAMVFGGVSKDLIQLNEDTFWAGQPRNLQREGNYTALPKIRQLLNDGKVFEAQKEIDAKMLGEYNFDYMPLADININFANSDTTCSDYRRELDLETGTVTVSYTKDGVKYKREYFVSYPDQALVIRLSSDKKGAINMNATLSSQVKYRLENEGNCVKIIGQAPYHTMPEYTGDFTPLYEDGKGMRMEGRLMADVKGGELVSADEALKISQADEVVLKFVTATSYNGFDKDPNKEGKDEKAICKKYMDAVADKSFDELHAAHKADFGMLFNRVSLDMGSSEFDAMPINKRIENYKPESDPSLTALYYQFGRYLLISCSREGSQPSNLQGIWNKDIQPEWSSNYTTNCNVEINYWNAEQGNLSECHTPLFMLIREASVDGAKTARNLYNSGGWMLHHNLDLWRTTWPVGGSGLWAIFQPANGWLLEHVWEHYQFSQDKKFLADNYDLMRGATEFHLDNLQRDKDGYLVTNPSESFENMYKHDGRGVWACIGSAQDMQIIRSLFINTIESSRILGIDEEFRARTEKALAELAPMRISARDGMLQEWNEDFEPFQPFNGQIGHGWAVSCSNLISLRKTPELAAAFRKLIEYRKPGYSYNSGSWTGSFPAVYWARLEEGDSVQRVVSRHFSKAVSKNLTSNFTGFWEIDGNFGITAAIGQMLLQSQDMEVHLLPALSSKYPKGSVKGLRARGGYTVDIEWNEGKITKAVIKADHDSELKVRHKDNLQVYPVKSGQSIILDSNLKQI